VQAATVWAAYIDVQALAVMTILRALSPALLLSLPDATA
jgi:hypothetical protein